MPKYYTAVLSTVALLTTAVDRLYMIGNGTAGPAGQPGSPGFAGLAGPDGGAAPCRAGQMQHTVPPAEQAPGFIPPIYSRRLLRDADRSAAAQPQPCA